MAMHKSKKQKRFQDGGDVNEAEMKQRGLDASNKEAPVSFFQRLKMGNIDDPKSEAYKKFGAGRGRAESAPAAAPAVTRTVAPAAEPAVTRTVAPAAAQAATSAGPAAGTSSIRDPQQMAASKASVGMDESDSRRKDAANAPSRATTSSSSSGTKPVTSVQPVTSGTKPNSGIVTKEQLEKSGFTNLRDYLNDQKKLDRRDGKVPERKANGSGSKPATTPETTTSKPATKPATTTSKPAGAPGLRDPQQKAQQKNQGPYRNDGRNTLAPAAPAKSPGTALPINPSTLRQRAEAERKREAARAAKRKAEEDKKKARSAKDEAERKALSEQPGAVAYRKKQEKRDEMSPGQRSAARGKAIKDFFGLKKGGSVSSASKRADGIAQRGKTRGRMY